MAETTTPPVTDLVAVTIDSPDAAELAAFYGSLTGGAVQTFPDIDVASVDFGGRNIYFQTVADYTRPQWPDQAQPQQFHLDFRVADLDSAVEAAVAFGAQEAAEQPHPQMWRVMIDPHGHPFCLCPPQPGQ